jgi:hypothetical protein
MGPTGTASSAGHEHHLAGLDALHRPNIIRGAHALMKLHSEIQ